MKQAEALKVIKKARKYMAQNNTDPAIRRIVAEMMGKLVWAAKTDQDRLEFVREAKALGVSEHTMYIMARWGG